MYCSFFSQFSWKNSPIYSAYHCGTFSFYIIVVPFLDLIHPAKEHIFSPVISCVFLCYICVLQFFLFYLCTFLTKPFQFYILALISDFLFDIWFAQFLGAICNFSFIRSRTSSVIYITFVSCFSFYRMPTSAIVTNASVKVYHWLFDLFQSFIFVLNCDHIWLFSNRITEKLSFYSLGNAVSLIFIVYL